MCMAKCYSLASQYEIPSLRKTMQLILRYESGLDPENIIVQGLAGREKRGGE